VKPLYGWRYQAAVPGAAAAELLVLTEDPWNQAMRDSVVVPIYRIPDPNPSVVEVLIADDLVAICTRVQNVPHEFFGASLGRCEMEPLTRVRIGVRRFLDIDARERQAPSPTPPTSRMEWWPRQSAIHFATNPRIGPDDKLYAIVADDGWNSRESTSYTAAVRLTSHTKPFRVRWEVPAAGSFVVSGDLYSLSYHRFERRPPRDPYPTALTPAETADVAASQRRALSLR
jgi:hypothetical protein